MPEGDTIHYAANRIRPILEGHVPDALETLHPRFSRDRWPERLEGQPVRSVDAHGKHLFIRFANDLSIRRGGKAVVQFKGPVLELMTDSRTRIDQRIAGLGPDILAPEFDYARFLRRLREDDPTRPIGDAVLDQRTVAGIGNLWKAEACWEAQIDPWRRTGDTTDEEATAIVDAARPRMQESARSGHMTRGQQVYNRAGRPCPRCGTRIEARGQWEDNRTTFWCPGCQR
jgi:endonuclease-8